MVPVYRFRRSGRLPVLVTVTHRLSGASPGLMPATENSAVFELSLTVRLTVPAAKLLLLFLVCEGNAAEAAGARAAQRTTRTAPTYTAGRPPPPRGRAT